MAPDRLWKGNLLVVWEPKCEGRASPCSTSAGCWVGGSHFPPPRPYSWMTKKTLWALILELQINLGELKNSQLQNPQIMRTDYICVQGQLLRIVTILKKSNGISSQPWCFLPWILTTEQSFSLQGNPLANTQKEQWLQFSECLLCSRSVFLCSLIPDIFGSFPAIFLFQFHYILTEYFVWSLFFQIF